MSALGAKKDWGVVLEAISDVVAILGEVDDVINAEVISRVYSSPTPIQARFALSSRTVPLYTICSSWLEMPVCCPTICLIK